MVFYKYRYKWRMVFIMRIISINCTIFFKEKFIYYYYNIIFLYMNNGGSDLIKYLNEKLDTNFFNTITILKDNDCVSKFVINLKKLKTGNTYSSFKEELEKKPLPLFFNKTINKLFNDYKLFDSGISNTSKLDILEAIINSDKIYDNVLDFIEQQFVSLTKTYNKDDSNGIVVSFIDSIVIIKGLLSVKANELLYFERGVTGLALNLEYNQVKALVFSDIRSIVVGESVKSSGFVMRVGVSESLLGRIINPLGKALDGLGSLSLNNYLIMDRKAPGVIMRKKVSEPVMTGIKVIDALVPIGRGQRELILGDRKTGKTTIAIDTILNQNKVFDEHKEVLTCVYVAIGKRMSEIVKIYNTLKENSSLQYTILVIARSSDPASLQFIAPYVGCTIAEYFTYNGKHSLIIYDDLTKHADVYRQISLLLRRPVGREAYPGDVFFLHSKLLERAVKLNETFGFGSLTALPIIETIQGDVSAYIPTNVISITDGQIYLDLNKHQEGVRPAVDPGISVSRVGSSAQTKLMKMLSGSLKLDLAQYREVEQFSKFGSELDASTKFLLKKGKMLISLMKQVRNNPLSLVSQIVILYLSSSVFFLSLIDKIEEFDIESYLSSLIFFIEYSIIFRPYKYVLGNSNVDNLVDLE
ncbi:uncharacterized protein LOC126321793 [Schistocerca gregaria]|uniref:uncharacterized protein LOC126321793 n=1 Tax=Schistocerca gregaria TaxID=7010 RepID=UPI00211DD641|nr:uncharacterized protein LOC126321793 [Schistocerca gregaria]